MRVVTGVTGLDPQGGGRLRQPVLRSPDKIGTEGGGLRLRQDGYGTTRRRDRPARGGAGNPKQKVRCARIPREAHFLVAHLSKLLFSCE
jgi:hypothetical protein